MFQICVRLLAFELHQNKKIPQVGNHYAVHYYIGVDCRL